MASDTIEFDPASFCLQHFYGRCSGYSGSRYAFHTLTQPHRYELNEIVNKSLNDDTAQEIKLARQTCEYLLKSTVHKDTVSKCASFHHNYAEIVHKLNKGSMLSSGDRDICRKHHLRAIELAPQNSTYCNNFAVFMDNSGSFDKQEIEKYYKKACDLNPADEVICGNYATFLCQQGRYGEAMNCWRRPKGGEEMDIDEWIKNETSPYQIFCFGKTLFCCGEFEDSLRVCQKLIEHDEYDELGAPRMKQCEMMIECIKSESLHQTESKNKCNFLSKMLIEKVKSNDNNCFEMWYNDNGDNISIDLLIKFMKICKIPITSLIKYVKTKKTNVGINETLQLQKKMDEIVDITENYLIPLIVELSDLSKLKRVGPNNEASLIELENGDTFNNNHTNWQANTQKLTQFCNGNERDLLLTKYHESIQLIKQQNQLLSNDWQNDIKSIAKNRQELHAQFVEMSDKCIEKNQSLKNIDQEWTVLVDEYKESTKTLLNSFDIIKKYPAKAIENVKNHENINGECESTKASLNKIEKTRNDFENIMNKYRSFEKETESIIPKLLSKFEEAWEESEKEWYNWDIVKTMGWFEYVLRKHTNNSEIDCDSIEFDAICDKMRNEKFKAKFLTTIDDSDLKEYGFGDENVCQLLYEAIFTLCEKYPMPKKIKMKFIKQENNDNDKENGDSSDENKYNQDNTASNSNNNDNENDSNSEVESVSSDLICPISNKRMNNPVIAFDGNTYDKENIINYWKENEKSPINGKKISNVDLAIADLSENKSLKRKLEQNKWYPIKMEKLDKENEKDGKSQDFDVDVDAYMEHIKTSTGQENEENKGGDDDEDDDDDDDDEPPKKRQKVE